MTRRQIEAQRFGRRLKTIRTAKGLRQADVAKRVRLDVTVVCRIERGERVIRVSDLARFAAALDVSVEELVSSSPVVPAPAAA